MKPAEILEHISSRCREDAGCWIWQGAVQHCGTTPTMRIPGTRKTIGVRRLVLQCCRVDLRGKFATNTCESQLCVAPEHLAAMTRQQLQAKTFDNLPMSTRIARDARMTATQRSKAKLTPEIVELIRQSPMTTRQIAHYLGVSQHTVWAALSGRHWQTPEAVNPFRQLMR